MSRLGFKSVVYHREVCLGELDTIPVTDQNFQFPNNEIRIHHISSQSERCPPLSILQTISSFSVRCKLESSSSPIEQTHLINLHASCFHECKTIVVLVGDEEIHLVAMPSKQKKFPCFWCYSVPLGLYNACLGMLNLRCLAIVFDLDETLIVANTMKSFEDRIEALRAWIVHETDPIRKSGMLAEMNRYIDDKMLLKQYAESDSVVDNGKMFKVQLEEIPSVSDTLEKIVRPVIRLQDKNIVLTRINPEVRDTSVLVRLRPAWEDLRSYLTAKGRKRFEVYVCTMAERDYALEMWRLLDPEANLIGFKQLMDRVVCVKSGSKKSLLNVFQDGMCHPKMAMVIDDRLKVWEDKDQPQVHVVPAFTPYYAPQAETANAVPVLCVARNVACNVRGCFFKEFDENLLRRIVEVFYEDEVVNLPPAPEVSNYLMSEDAGFVPNGNTNAPISEGMNGVEVERRLNQLDEKYVMDSFTHSMTTNPKLRPETFRPTVAIIPNAIGPTSLTSLMPSQKPSLLGAPVRRDVNTSDPLKHGLDLRNQSSGQPPLLSRLPAQISSYTLQPQGGWLVEEDINRAHLHNRPSGFAQESDASKSDKLRAHQNPYSHSTPGSTSSGLLPYASQVKNEPSGLLPYASQVKNEPSSLLPHASQVKNEPSGLLPHASQVKSEKACAGQDMQRQNPTPGSQPLEVGISQNHTSSYSREFQTEGGKLNLLPSTSSYSREFQTEGGKLNLLPSHLSIGVLQEIGRRCSSKVEFRSVLSTSEDLQFSVEVLFTGEKIGVGMGKTRKDAQQQAAENALHSLAEKYVAYIAPRSGAVGGDFDKLSLGNENGFLWDNVDPGSRLREDGLPKESTTEAGEVEAGSTSSNLVNQQVQKRANSPRLPPSIPSKRSKEELQHGSQSLSSSRQQ